jgi:two-component sensor histidine kinase
MLIVIGLLVGTGAPALPGGGRALPRIPAPPQDLGTWLRRLGVGSVTWYACALAIGPLWWLANRFPLAGPRLRASLSIHAGALAVLSAVTSLAHYQQAFAGSPYAPRFLDFAPVALGSNAIPLLAVAAVVHVLETRRRAIHTALESQRLRAELADSRLAAVTAQLQPHFLFNTLQSISTLIHRDPVAADAMLVKLSDLLREVLRRSRSNLVPLSEELHMAETYLDLARIRFGDRLRVELDVDPDARRALVPVLLLQPLIENALKHGVGRVAGGGAIGISCRRVDETIMTTVWDDGPGLDGAAPRENVGLGNPRDRLRHAFGEGFTMNLRPRPAGGVEVAISFPYREAPEGGDG